MVDAPYSEYHHHVDAPSKYHHQCGHCSPHKFVLGSYGKEPEWVIEFLTKGKAETLSPEYVEAIAILKALKLVVNSHFPSIHTFSDAQDIVEWICNPSTTPPWSIQHIIKECGWVLNLSKKVSLSFATRSTKFVAHKIVVVVVSAEIFCCWSVIELPQPLVSSLCITPLGVCAD